ncbi:family 78 glycoside hydrolase catalytic domain [Microlunatus flavus]|uniref:alpha-L-rhamnosidase n=1 Tax=Microlunatus flavus TaxID=1036181 RepID=A0A1H9D8U7_9ACTN|nr:family 78 glycoside hydrolase catalytic domain [Microlunatus flavus]SEQ09912.1 alpha-L-rhamnosidase [Microlunatus flavus]
MPEWSAVLVSPDSDFDGAPLLRTEVPLEQGHGEVVRAVLRATAHGVFEAYLNGHPVDDTVLSPGWSSYEWRLRFVERDVLPFVAGLGEGEPLVLGLALGNGWWRGRLGWAGGRAYYGDELGALAQLDLTFADGHTQVVGTDETWTAGPSAVTANDLYDGETIDARRLDDSWLRPGHTGAGWTGVHRGELDLATLEPYLAPPVRRVLEVPAQRVWTSPAGRTLVDFGQNLVGWVRVRVQGPAGSTVTLRHAEVLEHDELGTRPLRTALATDHFVLSGGEDVFEPTFTFHGFRYAEVEGWPGEPDADALTAVVVSSDLRPTGDFACSDELVTQLHRNAVWGTRGNFLDVPTDCPQRDERLGWTGDIAAFTPSAAYLFDVDDFLRDWLRDLAAEQRAADGMVAFVIPDVLKYVIKDDPAASVFGPPDSTAVWSDAAVWVPWALWQAYGDRRVLADQLDSMTAHVRRVETLLSPSGLWEKSFQFGDWLDPTAPPENAALAKADPSVVATACVFRSATLVAETAALLGHGDEAHFRDLAERTRAAFVEHYVGDDGRIKSDAVTVYALAIAFGLLDEGQQQRAGERLVELVREGGHHIQTGFAGTPFVTDALTLTGHLDDAYALLLQRECPSWLYPVTMGATTVWERWDSMLPDGTINPGQMTSFNHYALGAVVDWLHRTVAGLAPLEPGYARVLVAPQPGGGLTWARTSLETARGRVAVAWTRTDDGGLDLDVVLPEGVSGVVRLPGEADREIGPGEHHLNAALAAGVG